jgi:hypothetical protein
MPLEYGKRMDLIAYLPIINIAIKCTYIYLKILTITIISIAINIKYFFNAIEMAMTAPMYNTAINNSNSLLSITLNEKYYTCKRGNVCIE